MGGQQALATGLTHRDLFHWIGGFSSAIARQDTVLEKTYADALKEPGTTNKEIRLLWTACGKQDALFAANQAFSDVLDKHGIKHTFAPTEGIHQWPVWRRNLATFAPLLFAK